MSMLDRKLRRDLWHIRGQVLAIGCVIAAGIAIMVVMQGSLTSLQETRDAYYDRYRFADVFAYARRAPESLTARFAEIDGVGRVDTRIVEDIILDMPGLVEPARGRILSVPEGRDANLNRIYLRNGRLLEPGRPDEVIVNDAFADAHGLFPGDQISGNINGRRRTLTIVGTALSPEFIYTISPGEFIPDNRRFGILWMGRDALAAAFDLQGAFNEVSLSLTRDANELDVIDRVDDLLGPYGGVGAFGRVDHQSDAFLESEFNQLKTMSAIIPPIFIAVAAFLLNIVINRLIDTEREQVGLLKAFGYHDFSVGWHYMKFVLAIAGIGILLGWALGTWLGHAMTSLYGDYFKFPFLIYRPSPSTYILSGGLSVAVAAFAAWFAVRRAVRLAPAVAMISPAPPVYRRSIAEHIGIAKYLGAPSRMILRNLTRWPIRAALTSVGVSLSVAMLIMSLFMIDSIDEMLDLFFFSTQRQDVTLSFTNPRQDIAREDVQNLPGVFRAEMFRAVPVRLRNGHLSERVGITGIEDDGDLTRLLDVNNQVVTLPLDGIVLTDQLALQLGLRAGDWVDVEVMEGRRPHLRIPVNGISQEYVGLAAYMNREALSRVMEEAPSASGAYVSLDTNELEGFFASVKKLPIVQGVTLRTAALNEFRRIMDETMVTSIAFYIFFAALIAVGVVYNSARISLSERARELASMRVLGFTKSEVAGVLLGELAVITLISLPIGCVLGYLMAAGIVEQFATELFRLPFIIQPSTFGWAVLIVIIATVVTGAIVARRINNLDLVAVLKTRE